MIGKIEARHRHFRDVGWLKTCWLFSFSDYYDPENVHHGRLRVFNDDIMEPGTGFGKHPHEEMEIISIVLDGEMIHEDTMGNKTVIHAGDVQRMSAGTGLFHSERNESDKTVHFYQIWILPEQKAQEPSYDQQSFLPEVWKNRLTVLAQNNGGEGVVRLNADATVYRGAFDTGVEFEYRINLKRKLFVYVMSGKIEINGETFSIGDQARIQDETELRFSSVENGEVLVVDVS